MARGIVHSYCHVQELYYMSSFDDFNFSPSIAATLKKLGYTTPTPIQQQAIKPVLEGKDLLGLAQTGTGKTAAFTLPILQQLGADKDKKHRIRALILAPTRELAEQTHSYLEKFTRPLNLFSGVAYGGVSRAAQVNKLRRGVDILVACPGRLLDLANDRCLDLRNVQTLVLDEADQMLDQGFLPDIKRIIGKLPKERQNLVFSATMPREVHNLIDDLLKKPMVVEIEYKKAVKNIHHSFYRIPVSYKTALLKSLLAGGKMDSALVFTRTKMKAKRLALQLEQAGYSATSLQGNLSQGQRQKALDGFKKGTFKILVATDIASRGLDVENLSHVINFDMPENEEVYTHRAGRTGRAGRSGEAWTFATEKDVRLVRNLQRQLDGKVALNKPELASLKEFYTAQASSYTEERDDSTRRSFRPNRNNNGRGQKADSFDSRRPRKPNARPKQATRSQEQQPSGEGNSSEQPRRNRRPAQQNQPGKNQANGQQGKSERNAFGGGHAKPSGPINKRKGKRSSRHNQNDNPYMPS